MYAGGVLAGLILLAAGLVAVVAGRFLYTAPETPGREVIVVVEPGVTLQRVAWMLKKEGLVTNPEYFILLAEYKSASGSIRAGEFAMNTSWRPDRVLEELMHGRPVDHKMLLPEGLAWWDTAKVVEKFGLLDQDSFAAAINDSELLAKYNIPFGSAEGFLFPDTYHFIKDVQANSFHVVKRLIENFWSKTHNIWGTDQPDPERIRYVVILASLVEKETSVPDERRRVAGVFANRLRLGMLLQCDPTIIYGLGPSFSGPIRKSQLRDQDNLYNTYVYGGLPPGPICSPGLASLEAAANPEIHDYLYFVATGDGRHKFSRTLSEHNAAVYQYRKLNSKRQ